MVFNVTISLADMKAKNGKNYCILLADTVIVRTNAPEVLTGRIPRKYEEISYALQGDEEPQEKKKTTAAPSNKQTSKILNKSKSKRISNFKESQRWSKNGI